MTPLPNKLVTDEMIEAGFNVLWRTEFAQLGDKPPLYKETVRSIYRAMEAARPLPDGDMVEPIEKLRTLRTMFVCCDQPLYAQILDEVLPAIEAALQHKEEATRPCANVGEALREIDWDEIDDVIARLEISDPEAASYLKATDRELTCERQRNVKLEASLSEFKRNSIGGDK